MHRHVAFGLRWDSDVPLEQFSTTEAGVEPADVVVREADGSPPTRELVIGFDNASLYVDGVRLEVGDEVVFDVYPPARIDWRRGRRWAGRFPSLFYGTLTALLLAWRGAVPIHGSSVEIDGRAYLICGKSGAGKSTLAAALIASGRARLIADDLSVLERLGEDQALLNAGRPAIRLFPAVAQNMSGTNEITRQPGMAKWLVAPRRTHPFAQTPLAAMLLLGSDTTAIPTWRRAALLDAQVFRPRWMRAIPGWRERCALLRRVALTLPMLSMDPFEVGDGDAFRARASEVLLRIGNI